MNSNWPHPTWMPKSKNEPDSQPSSASSSKSFAAQQAKKSSRPGRHETERERNRNWPHPAPPVVPEQPAPARAQPVPTPAPARIPVPNLAAPNPLQVQICPLLCQGAYELVDYDLRVPLDYARKYLSPTPENPRPSTYLTMNDLRQPACYPTRTVLYVTAPLVYPPNHPTPGQWMITVQHSAGAPHVTVRDVLNTMYEAFHSPPDPNAWKSVEQYDPALRDVVVKAWKKRCSKRALRLNTSVDEQRNKGLMCMDWFGPKTYFGGLSLVNDGGQSGYEIWDFVVYEPTLD